MSLTVLIAHTGQRVIADPAICGSLDAFKLWLSRATPVASDSQVLLTAAGKQAKFTSLQSEVYTGRGRFRVQRLTFV